MACVKLTHNSICQRIRTRLHVISQSSSNVSNKSRSMTTLLSKMKVAVDRANEICISTDASLIDNNECVAAWTELDELIERYMSVSKDIQRKKKVAEQPVANTHDWDVVH